MAPVWQQYSFGSWSDIEQQNILDELQGLMQQGDLESMKYKGTYVRLLDPTLHMMHKFFYWNDYEWVAYDDDAQNQLNTMKKSGTNVGTVHCSSSSGHMLSYLVDIVNCLQKNTDTLFTRPIYWINSGIHSVLPELSVDDYDLQYDDVKQTMTNTENMVAQVPACFICPLSHCIFTDPVVAADGNTYERSYIQEHLKEKTKSPLTNMPLAHTYLVTNINLHETIRNWLTMAQNKKQQHSEQKRKKKSASN